MQTMSNLCLPRKDVLGGRLRDEEFVADISQVMNGSVSPERSDPALFCACSHPMYSLDRIRMVADGIDRVTRNAAGNRHGMALHRNIPRRVPAALRLPLSAS